MVEIAALRMTENVDRILAAIAHVISCAEEYGRSPTQYDIVKSLFLADRSHLNEWGRPITYDNYVAMKHGPVPSLAYDFLKGNEYKLRKHNVEELPWTRRDGGRGKYNYKSKPDVYNYEQFLSESDRDALEAACGTVLKLGFQQVRKLTHEDPAYLDAWPEDCDSGKYDMNLALLFDQPNVDAAEELAEFSKYVHSR